MLQGITCSASDHFPLVLTVDHKFTHSRHFKFENYCPKLDGYGEVVASACSLEPDTNDPFLRLHLKLSATAKALKAWSAHATNDIKLRAEIVNELIFQLDKAMDSRQLTPQEHTFRKFLKVQCLGLAAIDRCRWRQRSCFLCLQEGDCNSRFFHVKAAARRRKNFIPPLQLEDGNMAADQDQKIDTLWKHFNNLLGTVCRRHQTLNLDALRFDDTVDLTSLTAPVSEEEIKKALFSIHPSKVPGPDGFTGLFFRTSWELIKHDLMLAIRKLETANSQHLHKLNEANMILIHKFNGANKASDFRPISLIHSFSKIVSKVIATRLQPLMPQLVLPCQNAFIKRAQHPR